jgi:hypothetical protein
MRFTVVATGQFNLNRAFGFRLAASSLIQLSVVNSPIRPAGLPPAWQPASPAHSQFQRFSTPSRALAAKTLKLEHTLSDLVNQACALTPAEIKLLRQTAPTRMAIPPPIGIRGVPISLVEFVLGTRRLLQSQSPDVS